LSLDTPVGGPFNIAQYALLLMMIAQVVGMEADEFIWTIGDAHIYLDQKELVAEHIERTPLKLPTMKINPNIDNIFNFSIDDFELVGYDSHPVKLNYPVAT
jgi:thymidylate synthase